VTDRPPDAIRAMKDEGSPAGQLQAHPFARWVLDFRSVGERVMGDLDREVLSRRIARARVIARRFRLLIWIASLGFLPSLAIAASFDAVASMTIVVAYMLLLGPSILWFRDAKLLLGTLEADLGYSRIERFERAKVPDGAGPEVEPDSEKPKGRRAWREDEFLLDPDVTWFEIYPKSFVVAQFEGFLPKRRMSVTVYDIGSAPAMSPDTPFPARLHVSPLGTVDPRLARPLSQAELQELQRNAPRKVPVAATLLLAWTGYAAIALASQSMGDIKMLAFASFFGALFVLGLAAMAASLLVSHRHRRDLRDSVVVKGTGRIHEGDDAIGRLVEAEVLPNSRRPWTIDGEPAPWRRGHVLIVRKR
jgi:hypothetical protein